MNNQGQKANLTHTGIKTLRALLSLLLVFGLFALSTAPVYAEEASVETEDGASEVLDLESS